MAEQVGLENWLLENFYIVIELYIRPLYLRFQ